MIDGVAEGLLRILGRRNVEAEGWCSTDGGRQRSDDKKSAGEKVCRIYITGRGKEISVGGVGSVPPAVSIFVLRRRKNKQLLAVSVCFTLFTPVPHVKRLRGSAVLTSSADEMSELRLRSPSVNAGCNWSCAINCFLRTAPRGSCFSLEGEINPASVWILTKNETQKTGGGSQRG